MVRRFSSREIIARLDGAYLPASSGDNRDVKLLMDKDRFDLGNLRAPRGVAARCLSPLLAATV